MYSKFSNKWVNVMEEKVDPRFFISTKRQRDVAEIIAETEPQEVVPGLFLGSRDCVLHKKDHLIDLGIKSIVMCCDRRPDEAKTFEYKVVEVNNESKHSAQQHATHVHDDDEHDCADHEGGCGDLHLLQWIMDEGDQTKCLADELSAWIDSKLEEGNVLVHGFDGITNSAAVVVAYLMWKQNLRFAEALELVKSKREIVKLTSAITRDLKIYDTRLYTSRNDLKLRVIPKRNK